MSGDLRAHFHQRLAAEFPLQSEHDGFVVVPRPLKLIASSRCQRTAVSTDMPDPIRRRF